MSSVIHARLGVVGDASMCGFRHAANTTISNEHVTCPKCKRIVDKQTAEANAIRASERAKQAGASSYVKPDLVTLLDTARMLLLNDPALAFNAPPALAIDKFIARVLALAGET